VAITGNGQHQATRQKNRLRWSDCGMIERMKNLLLVFTFLLIAGCSTDPVAYKDARPVPAKRLLVGYQQYSQQKDGSVQVIMVRDSGLLNDIIDIELSINRVEVAKFLPSERLELFLIPGDYIFAIKFTGSGIPPSIVERQVQIQTEKSYAFRINNQYPHVLTLQPSTLLQ
jgi:hypothetical protein